MVQIKRKIITLCHKSFLDNQNKTNLERWKKNFVVLKMEKSLAYVAVLQIIWV
jgi:hypothetical protein